MMEEIEPEAQGVQEMDEAQAAGAENEDESWQAGYEAAECRHAAETAQREWERVLDEEIALAGPRNAKVVKAALRELLPADEKGPAELAQVREAIEALKQSDGYLFTGGNDTPAAVRKGRRGDSLDRDAFLRMGYRERLLLKAKNPALYNELRGMGK